MKKSERIRQEMAGKWETIAKLKKTVVDDESREYTQEERQLIETTLDEVKALEDQLLIEQKDEALSARVDDISKLFNTEQQKQQPPNTPAQTVLGKQLKSYGAQFAESEQWAAFLKKYKVGDRIIGSGFTSDPVEIKGLLSNYGRKELVTGSSAVSAGAFIVPDDTGIYEPIGRYPLTLRQLVDVRQTTSDSVEWVRQTRQADVAAPVPEANVTDSDSTETGAVTGEKPEATNRWIRESAPVITIAIWKPATTRALADVSQLRGLIDQELRDDVNEELENQMLNGNGVGENFTGLANTNGILVQALSVDIARTARMAITNLLINGRQLPTAWLLNPQDWEAFDLLQDTNGRYYWGGPVMTGPRTLWGVPVAQSFFLTQGTGYLGNWRKMVLWDREQATIAVSDSHADFFTRNMVAIRCDLRAAMGVIRPSAFVEVDLEATS